MANPFDQFEDVAVRYMYMVSGMNLSLSINQLYSVVVDLVRSLA